MTTGTYTSAKSSIKDGRTAALAYERARPQASRPRPAGEATPPTSHPRSSIKRLTSPATEPEVEYREEVHVHVKPGETIGRVYGGHVQLIRIALSDGGCRKLEDGTIIYPPDVISTQRPDDVKRLIKRLQDAIAHAERLSV